MVKELYGFNVEILDNDDATTYPRAIFEDNEGSFAVSVQQVQAVNNNELGIYIKANNKYFLAQGELIPVETPVIREDWEVTFTLGTVESEVLLDNITGFSGHDAPTMADFYGENTDNVDRHCEVRYMGIAGNLEYSPDGVVVPNGLNTEEEWAAAQNPDGYCDYDETTHSLQFSSGSAGNKVYKFIYHAEAF